MNISTVAAMREMDRSAIEEYGIPEELLMENAAHAVCSVLKKHLPSAASYAGSPVTVLCGPGNNGGDGLAVARMLYSDGYPVKTLLFTDPNAYRGAAKLNLEMTRSAGTELIVVQKSPARYIPQNGWIVDALLGTGLSRDVQGLYATCIRAVNSSPARVVSVDIPSGVDGDDGQIMGVAIQADCTVTFGLPKKGNLVFPGFHQCGELYVSHISFPRELYEPEDRHPFSVLNPAPLPQRDPMGHKGTFGDALFVAGGSQYYGAPYLSAYSFLRSGGGYARLAAPRSMIPALATMAPEVVYVPMAETAGGNTSLDNLDTLLEIAAAVDFIVIGPGTSLEDETQELMRKLAEKVRGPILIDGDGITAFADDIGILSARKGKTVLTPHPGELSRLTGLPPKDVVIALPHVVASLAEAAGATIVGKGAHSIVAHPDGRMSMNMSGNDGMATPGSGDVLAGTVPAMCCTGLEFEPAVETGVFLHGFAGDLAVSRTGKDGVTAHDISYSLPEAIARYRVEYETIVKDSYGAIKLL